MDFLTFVQLFGWPLLGLALAAIAAPLVGAYLEVRGTSFQGIALPQVAAFGIAVGYALWPLVEGADGHAHEPPHAALYLAGALALVATLAWLAHGRTESGHVAATFVAASAGTALAGQLSPHGELHVQALLRGEALASGPGDVLFLALATLAAALVVWRGWRGLTLVGFDPAFATTTGLRNGRWELLLHTLTVLVVLTGTLTVGALPLFALIVLPSLTAVRGAPGMRAFLLRSPMFGLAGTALGAVLAFGVDLPLGASVAAGCAAVALGWSLICGPGGGGRNGPAG